MCERPKSGSRVKPHRYIEPSVTTDTTFSLISSCYHQLQQWQSIFTNYTKTSPLILYVIKSRPIYIEPLLKILWRGRMNRLSNATCELRKVKELNELKQLQGFNASAQQPKEGSIRSKLHRNNSYKPGNPVKPTSGSWSGDPVEILHENGLH